MGFGPWDLFKLMFASGNVARHVGKSNWSDFDARYEQRRHEERIEDWIDDHKDLEMEAEYWAMIEDPEKYDEVWTILEEMRAQAIDNCLNRRPICGSKTVFYEPRYLEGWFGHLEFVDNGRVPLNNERIKRLILYSLMNERGRCPMFCIREKAEWSYSLKKGRPFIPK